jgi:cyclohexanone monooxygenase
MPTDPVLVGVPATASRRGQLGWLMILRLRQLGLWLLGFEAAPDVGGTWNWNRRPGARCDMP